MTTTLELAGWVLAAGGVAAAALVRYRMAKAAHAVARTCHELRGPLTAVQLGLALAARTGQLLDARVSALELELGRAALALEDLTDGWGRPPITRVHEDCVDLARLVSESVEAWRGPAALHGATVTLAESRSRPVVRGERLRLAQAIGNLLSNAVEHGGDRIEVSCRADGSKALIEVRDDGPGLPAPLSVIVRRRRWDRGRAARLHGHGLAVAIAVVKAHGGRLGSAPAERGARLVLELPRAEACA